MTCIFGGEGGGESECFFFSSSMVEREANEESRMQKNSFKKRAGASLPWRLSLSTALDVCSAFASTSPSN